jgi:outer membrane protein OmpA-like peptidoglycan-associated protein
MNHRIFFLLSAFAVVYGVRAQGYLESERWLGYAKPTTEVYYDEADKRLLLVDQQLDYLQLRYAAKGKGLKPTQIQRIPLAKWGSARILGFSQGRIIVDSASQSGGTVYALGLDSSYRSVFASPVFADSNRVLGSQILDIDRRAVGTIIASKQWTNGRLELANQVVLADGLRPDWLSYQMGRWIAIWPDSSGNQTFSFLSSGGVWNQFPYPINQSTMVPKQMFFIDNDSLFVLGTKGDSAVFNFLRLRKAPVNSVGDRVKLGDFTMFYETTKAMAPSPVSPVLNPGEKSTNVVPNQNSVGSERTKKKGRFAVLFDTFKNADDAYALLNGLMGKFPDAYAVDTKEGIAVMGPNRFSLSQIVADSSRAFSEGIGIKKMVTYADKLKERRETLVTLQVYNEQTKASAPFTLVFFNRGTDRIIFSDTVRTGRINFIYSHGAELGVAVSSAGYFPQSIRLNPDMAPIATHYFHDMFLKPTTAPDPLNPKRMVVQSAELDFQNILFDFNSSEPRRISYVEINAMKDAFANLDSIALVLEGHTDDVGSDEYNYELGRLRAESVSAELRKSLRPTASLSTISLGESMAIAANDNDFHRSLNRRVSLVVKAAPKPAASSMAQEVPVVEDVLPETSDAVEDVLPETSDAVEDESVATEPLPESLEVSTDEVENIPAEEKVIEVQEVPSLLPSKAVQKENAKITKDLEREAKEKSRKNSLEKEKNAKAAKLEQLEKKKAAEAIEEARLRRTLDVAAQNKAEFEAKQALIKESEKKAKQQAKDAKAQAKEKKKKSGK